MVDDTIISSVTLFLVTSVSTGGAIYIARLSRKVDHVKDAVHTANGDTLGQIAEAISEKQDRVKDSLDALDNSP